jgi:uncharacterized protein YpuA (DUF1002 family)
VYNDFNLQKKIKFDYSKVEKEVTKVTEQWEQLVNELDSLK